MAITIIKPEQLKDYLGKGGEAVRKDNPKMAEILESLADAIAEAQTHDRKNKGRKPDRGQLSIEAPAYLYSHSTTLEDIRKIATEAGHIRPMRRPKELEKPNPQKLKKLLSRCLGTKRQKANAMGYVLLSERGIPENATEVSMWSEMMDEYEAWEARNGITIELYGMDQIANHYSRILWDDENNPWAGKASSTGKIAWATLGNGSTQFAQELVHSAIEAMQFTLPQIKQSIVNESSLLKEAYGWAIEHGHSKTQAHKEIIEPRTKAIEGWKLMGLWD